MVEQYVPVVMMSPAPSTAIRYLLYFGPTSPPLPRAIEAISTALIVASINRPNSRAFMFPAGMSFTATDIVVSVTTLVCFTILYKESQKKSLSLPPGPHQWPVIGSLLSMPSDNNMRETFAEWKHTTLLDIGDVVYARVLGQDIVLLNSREAALELLEDADTANRVGWGDCLAIMRYGERHKRMRKLFHEGLSPKAIESGINSATNATVLKVTYGYSVKDKCDPILTKAEEAINMFSYVTLPGMWLVDYFPISREWKKLVQECVDMPADFTTEQMVQGKCEPCLISKWFEQADEQPGGKTSEADHFIRWTGTSIYGAATDTAQKAAQTEIDHIIGNNRLPKLSDRDSLPYVEAVYKEVLRWQPVAPFAIPHTLEADDDMYHGCVLVPNIWGMSRDPTVYQDPETFKPERFMSTVTHEAELDSQSFIFGFGRSSAGRRCPGIHLAQSTLWLAIATVLAVYDITPVLDTDGRPVMPSLKYSQSSISAPNPFQCTITPRTSRTEKIIQDSAIEA
ncbi:cytochrome P450 oxidoreductase OrdA-like, putative [Rhizoctonia solani AG-1 IA]|uniref:Cytochrome P450 oxidoreductase OrdA-like, putative n=1 Tax=Thanatephorus cucumeris (strain AG1-IA) TaxID=983506 RepID=L8WZC3_THACA|nr:cytochrome P450 oxidoreductase OrdA-like, putative [Rhizoctonia solani AG-1 IA]